MLRLLVLATWLSLVARTGSASDWKPLAVASLSSWKELQADLGFLGQLIQNPDLADRLGKSLFGDDRPQSSSGLDHERPVGLLVRTNGLRIVPMVFIPVADLPQLLRSLTPITAPPQQVSPATWKIGETTLTGFVRERNGWAYLAQTADVLDQDLPDPMAAMGELAGKYDVAATFYPANLPEALRTLVIDDARDRKRLLSDAQPDQESITLPKTLAALPHAWVEETFTEVRQLSVGWTLDRQQKAATLDVLIVPLGDSPAARRWAAYEAATSRLKITGAANATSLELLLTRFPKRSSEDSVLRNPQSARGVDSAEGAHHLHQLFEVLLDEAAAADPGDAILRILGKNPPYVVTAAVKVRSTHTLEQRIQALAALDTGASGVRVKLDVARIGDVSVHAIEPIAASGQLQKLLGNDLTIYLLVGKAHVSVACGQRAMAALEKSLPRETAENAAVVELTVHLGAALTAYARTTSQKDLVPLLTLAALSLQAGDDRLILTADAKGEGLRARLECREAVLRAAALGLSLASQPAAAARPTRPARIP
jgi:hypothetical protein